MDHAFGKASNMVYNATVIPDFSALTNLQFMFYSAESFNADLSNWNVSSVTSMKYMFNNADSFNGDLSGWDVSNVENMHGMFFGTAIFNQNLPSWDVSSVTGMNRMFSDATAFNQDISSWNVSAVTDMTYMFVEARAFDQNLGKWYTVLDDADIDYDDAPGTVGCISAQNPFLDGRNATYGIAVGGDSDSFKLDGADLVLKEVPTKRLYTVTINATGDFGSSNSKSVAVTVRDFNQPPVVGAGTDQTVREGDTVTLSGTATDADGDSLTYKWTHDSALSITLADDASPSTTFEAPAVDEDAAVTFTLMVSDGNADVEDTASATILEASDFVTTWETSEPGQSITVSARGKYTIDWGDGTTEKGVSGSRTHTYGGAGSHTIRISDGIRAFRLADSEDAHRLASID